MAECHPVGFQWVMEAKAKGATIIHVDPRFTRTSAVADQHVPLRAGSDIAFLGGIVNYILANDAYFHDYVVAPPRPKLVPRPGTVEECHIRAWFSIWIAPSAVNSFLIR